MRFILCLVLVVSGVVIYFYYDGQRGIELEEKLRKLAEQAFLKGNKKHSQEMCVSNMTRRRNAGGGQNHRGMMVNYP